MILVEIAGFLGADAEERYTAKGKRVIGLRVATRVRQGGRDETVWWRVNIWGDRFDKMLPFLKKGTSIIVVGEMALPEIYTGKDGTPQISLTLNAEIVKFSPFGRPDKAEAGGAGQSMSGQPMTGHPAGQPAGYPAGGSASQRVAGEPVFAHASSSQDDPFTGDDLPF